jgi:hypothetical protein
MRIKSPLLLKLLAALFFLAGLYYFFQAGEAIRRWNMLVLLKYYPSPVYPIFQGILLGGAFLVGGVLLIRRLPWAGPFNMVLVLLTLAWTWLDRTVLSMNPLPFSHQVFAIICSIMITVLMEGGLWALQLFLTSTQTVDKSSSEFFSSGENHE